MDVPQYEFYPDLRAKTLIILFRVISRSSWDELQSWHEAFPGTRVEHVLHDVHVLVVQPGGARRLVS